MADAPPSDANTSFDRLRKRADFLAARGGVRAGGRFARLEMLRRDGTDTSALPRVGLTVTKRCGNATERNRIKRRLREAVRLVAARDMRPHHDYVIIAKRDALTARFDALCEDLRAMIDRAHGQASRRRRSGRPDRQSSNTGH